MLTAFPFEPSRFFLKGKVRQNKISYIHKHTVREEVSQVWKCIANFFIDLRKEYKLIVMYVLQKIGILLIMSTISVIESHWKNVK